MVFCNIMLYNTIAVQKIGMTEDLSALVSGPINEIQGVKMEGSEITATRLS